MSAKKDPIAWFQQQLEQHQARHQSQEPEWLTSFRTSAMLRFAGAGFPTKKYEEWKYTKLSHLLDAGYTVERDANHSLNEQELSLVGASLTASRLVFVDGVFDADLSTLSSLPDGVFVGSLAVALRGDEAEAVRVHLAKLLDSRVANPLTYLNMALFEDGFYVHVPRNVKVEGPIEMVFVSSGQLTAHASHPRNIVNVEQGGDVSLIERYISVSKEADYWSNPATALLVADNANVTHIKIQDEARSASHFAQMHVEQGRDSELSSHLFSVGGKTSRHEVETVLQGENITCRLNCLYLAGQDQHMDNRIFMEHNAPHGYSDQYYKGILSGNGSGAFSGRIFVQREAQKTDAYQTHQALLLSDDASVYSKPQLEIYADDVKCSHGATTGNIDQDALFYLRSRGIPKAQAEHMLVLAFAEEMVKRIDDENIQEYIHQRVARAMQN